ncbi:MAG: imidazoleglycerol-phosphate dehydratase HisB [Desulfobacterales bacterium]
MERKTEAERKTRETAVTVSLTLDGEGRAEISTGIPFFDHMLTLFTVHGFFNLGLRARGDIEVDQHHTVEDVGIVLGEAIDRALGERQGIRRYGYAVTPMDDALAAVAIDLSRRPFLVLQLPAEPTGWEDPRSLPVEEFFRAVANRAGMNLHISVPYGRNGHHILEAVFKSFGRALSQAVEPDPRVRGVRSSKGVL